MNRHTHAKRSVLALALGLALAAPGMALAQDAGDQDLEARIAQLEQMVQVLKAELEAQKAADAAKPAPPAAPVQDTTIMPAAAAGTKFSFGGFVKLDAMLTQTDAGEIADGSPGRLFYLPTVTPVGGADESDADLDVHAQFSRFWFAADSEIAGKKARAYIEADLFGNALGNEQSTNTYGLTIRHFFFTWDKWLAGQTWSNFQDVAALPDAVDFVGPTEGTIFVRQAQLRYSNGPWSFSLENPETTITPFGGGARVSSDDNHLPDLTARWTTRGDWGHFSIAGLARQFAYQTTTIDEDGAGYAVSLSGKWNLGPSDDIRYMASAGRGLGRYLGFGIASDVATEADGSLEGIDGYGGFVAWRHVFSPRWRSSLFYSFADFDNDPLLTGGAVTRSSQSFHANLIYSPNPKLDIGAALIFAERELEDGSDGELNRLHMHFKYNF